MSVKMMHEKWQFLSVEETEKKLNTSAASGLTRKAARGRLQKAGPNAFFLLPHTSPADCIREVITQPSTILLIALSILLMFFEQAAQGRLLFVMLASYSLVLVVIRLWCAKIFRIPAKTSMPQVRVIREGQMYLLRCSQVVPGDLIELEGGDIVPCDCRLVSQDPLRVLTYLGTVKGEEQYERSLKQGNDMCVTCDQHNIADHGNMLYGGSFVEHGFARALVVETGKHTYIGALQGGYPLKTAQTVPEYAARMRKIANLLQIGLLLAVLPLLFLCLVIGKTEESLPLLFASLLCLCLANLAGNMETWLHFSVAVSIHRALRGGEIRDETALIRTNQSIDLLSHFDYLFLLGPQAFSKQTFESDPDRNLPSLGLQTARETSPKLGGDFLASRREALRDLRWRGILPIVFLECAEPSAIRYLLRTGIVESEDKIAVAEKFRSSQRTIVSDWGKYHAYCGFANEELRGLMIELQKQGKRVAVFGNLPREYALLKQADVSFAGVDDIRVFTDSNRVKAQTSKSNRGREDVATQRMRQLADVLIPCADRKRGGISAILHTVQIASNLHQNLISLSQFLLYTQLIRMMLILPTLVAGIHTVPPIQTVYSGLFADFIFACMILLRNDCARTSQHPYAITHSWRTIVLEAVFSGSITLTAFLFIYHNYPDRASASSALFGALVLMQLIAFILHYGIGAVWRSRKNWRSLLACYGVFSVLSIMIWFANRDVQIGLKPIEAPYGYLLLAAPLSIVLVNAVLRLYQNSRNR